MLANTLVEKTQSQIRALIINKEFDKNNYLPSEGELCERFGVSRVTVREAVRSMEVRGLLRRVHGKGIQIINNSVQVMTQFINDMLFMKYSDLAEVNEVRGIIEVEVARLAAERATPEDMESMRRNLEAMEASESMDDAYYTNDMEFHINLVKAAQNHLLYTMANAYTPVLKDVVIMSSQLDYVIERRYRYHRNVFDSIVSHDGDRAADTMRVHLMATRDNFCKAWKDWASRESPTATAKKNTPLSGLR